MFRRLSLQSRNLLATIPKKGNSGGGGLEYTIDQVDGLTITDPEGTLYDDGGPDNTYSQTDYTTYIQPPAGQQVKITMKAFEMGSVGGGSFNEKLRFFNIDNGSGGAIVVNFYGSTANGDSTAPTANQVILGVVGATVTIIFDQSGYYGENGFFTQGDAGFHLEWEFV